MKNLLFVTAVLETATGAVLMMSPALPVQLLLGAALDAPVGLILARVAGAALLALGVACWLARDDGASVAARGMVTAMLLYNVAAVAVLTHAGLGLKLSGIGLWPAVLLHSMLAGWCIGCVRTVTRAKPDRHTQKRG